MRRLIKETSFTSIASDFSFTINLHLDNYKEHFTNRQELYSFEDIQRIKINTDNPEEKLEKDDLSDKFFWRMMESLPLILKLRF